MRVVSDGEHGPVIVVGAGPAGLAVGACLKEAGVPAVILEQADRVGASWRRHYERLHLHTDKSHSGLPLAPFPRDYPRYPSRRQVIEYLEAYADRFHLDLRMGQKVVSAGRTDGAWEVQTQVARFRSPSLVIASGYNRQPFIPEWPGQGSFHGTVLHSSEYRSGEAFRNQNVLVVGFGNSGGEIAIDLWEHGAQPNMAVRGPVNVIPRELIGIPILSFSFLTGRLPPRLSDALTAPLRRAAIGDLTRYGLQPMPYGPLSQVRRTARIPLIDVGTIDLIKKGKVALWAGIERFTEQGVVFTDGRESAFDSVILATGYRPRVDAFLADARGVCDEGGSPASSGRETALPGLYFCGFFVSANGMLRTIAREAMHIASEIKRKR